MWYRSLSEILKVELERAKEESGRQKKIAIEAWDTVHLHAQRADDREGRLEKIIAVCKADIKSMESSYANLTDDALRIRLRGLFMSLPETRPHAVPPLPSKGVSPRRTSGA
jgi:hypothetical protein